MRCFNEKITERISRYIPTYCATIILGLAAHMFMLANKICFAGDAGGLFRKGDTIVSGRWGLALTSYIMPDISMPWLNGLMSLLLIGVAVCMTVSIFKIRSRALQILLAGLIVCSPAQRATFCIKELLEKEKTAGQILVHGIQPFAILVLGVKLAIAAEEPELRYDMASNFDFSGFHDPDIDIKNRIHAEGIINSFVGSAVPFASEEEIEEIKKNAEYDEMSVYPYYGSVKRINDCIVVKLGE